MTRLVVTTAGPATSVQDGGRFGAQRYGLPPSGALDRTALATANCLVGNAAEAAAIEIGPLGAAFTAQDGAVRFALSGAARTVRIGSATVALNTSAVIAAGETLTLGPARQGVFTYLAVEGGLHGEPVFGSLSVNARAGLGSPFPRPLQAGDALRVAAAILERREQALDLPPATDAPIRVVMGPQDDEFGDARDVFLGSAWTISATSDRMGYRLEGPMLAHDHGYNIVSDGTVDGSIQVPGSGQPIVLMRDRGTSGGYPKIATVIGPDLGRLAQMPAGSTVRFAAIGIDEAQAEARRHADFIRALSGRLREAGSVPLNLAELHHANVAGAAVNATDTATWHPHTSEQVDRS